MKIFKKTKDESPDQVKSNSGIPTHGLFGILLLFVSVSIAYANYVVFFGTEGLIPKLMLIPSTMFITIFLIVKAAK